MKCCKPHPIHQPIKLTKLTPLTKLTKLIKLTQLVKLVLLALLLSACGGAGPGRLEPADLVAQIPVSTARPAIPTPTFAPTLTPLPPTAAPAQAAAPEAAQPEPALSEAPLPAPTETETPEPTATFTPAPNWLNHSGRTVDGLMYLGNPDAPVTLTDFSDFL